MDRTTADGIRADQTIAGRFFGRAEVRRGGAAGGTFKRAFIAVNDSVRREPRSNQGIRMVPDVPVPMRSSKSHRNGKGREEKGKGKRVEGKGERKKDRGFNW